MSAALTHLHAQHEPQLNSVIVTRPMAELYVRVHPLHNTADMTDFHQHAHAEEKRHEEIQTRH
jgi:hypothetical protein